MDEKLNDIIAEITVKFGELETLRKEKEKSDYEVDRLTKANTELDTLLRTLRKRLYCRNDMDLVQMIDKVLEVKGNVNVSN